MAVEALLHSNHPARGFVGPDVFIPLAEETRLIVPVGEYVLGSACAEIGRMKNGSAMRLSVNLSARQFQEMTLLQTIDRIVDETVFDPADCELEVTESVAMQNADFTMSLLRDLRRRNISIAIDDFGAGQFTLIYLRQFPINNIKIDKVFISDMLTDPHRRRDRPRRHRPRPHPRPHHHRGRVWRRASRCRCSSPSPAICCRATPSAGRCPPRT